MLHKHKTFLSVIAVSGLFAGIAMAQDAKAVLEAADKAMGGGNLKSIQYSATGHAFTFGQALNPKADWPSLIVTAYTRTVDYPSMSSREEQTRTQENPPVHGGGFPFAGEQKSVALVSGSYAWNQAGNQAQPAFGAADERQLQIMLTPHGFIKAAMANNATVKNGRGGKVVSFTALGKYKVSGVIDKANMVTETETWVANPVLGDMPIETMYSNYKDFGGVKFPTAIIQKQGGSPVLNITVSDVKTNVANAALEAPANVRDAKAPPVRVVSKKLGDGIWFLGGGSHNSVLVEYKDYLTVIEAPLSEERSLAVIDEVKKLVPNKPIKYLVNTHTHFDHTSGLRTYMAEGATIITNELNKPYYEKIAKMPHTLVPDKQAQSPKKVAVIGVKEKYVLTDGNQTLEFYKVEGDNHSETMMMAYLPKAKVLVEADAFTPPAQQGGPLASDLAKSFGVNLYNNVQRLKLDVSTIAPLHGDVCPFSWLATAVGKSST